MARRREVGPSGSHRRLSHSPATSPLRHFFKIILPSTTEDKKLRIPDKFVREFGDELLDVAEVVVPNGHAWKIRLTKAQNNIWFDDGWQEFVEHNSIGYGYLLVFTYRGLSNFSVLVFDKTSCEIQYSCTTNGGQAEICSFCNGGEMEGDDSVEVLGSAISNPCRCSLENRVFVASETKGKSSKRHDPSKQNWGMNKRGRFVASQDSPNFEHVNSTRSQKCVKEQNLETADLDDVNETTRANFNKQGIPGPHGQPLSDETKGKNKSKTHLDDNVSLPKCEEYMETIASGFAMASQESKRAIHAARMFKTKNPYFMFLLRPHNIRNCVVYVPLGFAERHLSRASEYIKLQVSDGREWPVRINRNGGMFLSKGWKEFSRENSLEEGDVCVLELIKDKNVVLKVSIFRAAGDDEPLN